MPANPRSIAVASLRLGPAIALAIALALATWARTARAEPLELELRFAPDAVPCLTRDQLLAATKQRLARRAGDHPTATGNGRDAPAAVAIALEIGAAPGGWHAAITSLRRQGGERGVRELSAAGCADLLDPLSLVLALIVEEADGERPSPTRAPRSSRLLQQHPCNRRARRRSRASSRRCPHGSAPRRGSASAWRPCRCR